MIMKLIKVLTISFCIIIILSQNIFALSEVLSTADDWMDKGKEHAGIGISTAKLKDGASDLFNILLAVATGVAVVVGAILGLQYMTAGIDAKVQVKESLIPYLISCIVVFGSFGIWKLVVTIMSSF